MTDLGLALRLVAIDRWPTRVTAEPLWTRLRFADAFLYRWHGLELPGRAAMLERRLERLGHGRPAQLVRRQRARQQGRRNFAAGSGIELVNSGPGGRRANSLQVAVAVDAHRNGAPASALGWSSNRDPVAVFDLSALPGIIGAPARVSDSDAARRVVASWGPGAKGIVSVRDPDHVFLHVLNVTNCDGHVTFEDFSTQRPARRRLSRAGGAAPLGSPVSVARRTLDTIDHRSAFASVVLWRTANIAGATRLPDDLFTFDDDLIAKHTASALPEEMPPKLVDLAVQRASFFGDRAYSLWLVEQIQRGAATLLPSDLCALGPSTDLVPLTRIDEALLHLASAGRTQVSAGALTFTGPDNDEFATLLEPFSNIEKWSGTIDGLAPGLAQWVVDAAAWQRLHDDGPHYEPPGSLEPASSTADDVENRRFSWLEVNRAVSPGQRRTNCWNCAAATANWLRTAAPSTGLPVYREAPFRPTIPEFLAMVGTVGKPVYLDASADPGALRREADAIVRSWGNGAHGLVVASLTRDSTHIFNAVDDQGEVRYLDGHTATDGAENFGRTWVRIGLVRVADVFVGVPGNWKTNRPAGVGTVER